MKTISTSGIPDEQISELVQFAEHRAGKELQEVLMSLADCLRRGAEVGIVSSEATLTPNQAASHLGISRSHLYKVLDRGEIVSHRVGRDRRIRLADLMAFEARRQQDRRELAERFAHQQQTRDSAIDEVAELL